MKILKIVLMALASLMIGIGIAGYLTGVSNPSPLASLGNVFTSLKQSLGQALVGKIPEFTAPGSLPQEGYPTPGVTMSPADIANTEAYFNKLSGIDMEKKKKEEEQKEKDAKTAKGKDDKKKGEHDIKIPSSLFPIPKRRKSIQDSDAGETGAVYAMGTSPYGPPADVKAKIFTLDSLLYIHNDPQASLDDYAENPYKKHEKPLLFERKVSPQEHSLPHLDHNKGFMLQLGAFEKEERAEKLKKKLISKGYDVGIYKEHSHHGSVENPWYCVRLNETMNEKEAYIRKQELEKNGASLVLIVPTHKESI
jgi:hypothetical protein